MTDETYLKVCGYKSPGGLSCQREANEGDFCIFHQGCDQKLNEDFLPNRQFQSAFDLLLEQKDGNWDGFVFPTAFQLPNRIEFPVYLRWARFVEFDQSNTTFQDGIDFSDAIFLGNVIFRRVTFESGVIFDRCRFESCFELQYANFKASASFHRAEFSKRAVFRARFGGSCNLNETTFREGVNFAGWSETFLHGAGTVSLSQSAKLTVWQNIKKQFQPIQAKMNRLVHQEIRRFKTQDQHLKTFRVFESSGQLINVVFVKPDQVSFSEADLSRVYLSGTNLRGVRFPGVNWWQPKLARNGLYDELFIRLSNDGPHRFRNLPALEQTCRNVRVSLEESRDFNVASDFYIAEMEALRAQLPFVKRHFFSVPALYHFVSYYGTSVGAGLRVLVYLLVLHLGLTLLIHSPETITQLVERIPEDALRTVKILSLQMGGYGEQASQSIKQRWIDGIFRILAPIQIAMLVLAFRARIKRS
ncbi:MAG: pentapeptide repeat-containing protein [Methylobacter tundripaludum]|nr:pentapeptide repeat-containing protein [Methylobacter tundripaludum]